MSAADTNDLNGAELLAALGQLRDLCHRLKLGAEAKLFESYRARFERQTPNRELAQQLVGGAIFGMPAGRIAMKLLHSPPKDTDYGSYHELRTGTIRLLWPETAESNEGSLETRVDKYGEEIMASSHKAEARQWMKERSHTFFKADPKAVAAFVEAFYRAGAEQVLITDIEEHGGIHYGEGLLIVLPKNRKARARLFAVGARAEAAFQNDAVSDQGQKYLYYTLD